MFAVDLELIDGWIQDVYTDILDRQPWKRLTTETTIAVPASYSTGTVTVTQGSAALVGVGTAWLASMEGLMVRIDNEEEYYQLSITDGTTATLDRIYEGASGAGKSYRIDQPVFVMPSGCRLIKSVAPTHDRLHPLDMISPLELDRISVSRAAYGTPEVAVPTFDNFSDPPRLQLELYPVPESPNASGDLLSFVVTMEVDPAALAADDTGANLLPWAKPATIIDGVGERVSRWKVTADPQNAAGHVRAAGMYKTSYEEGIANMVRINNAQIGVKPLRTAPELRRQGLRGFRSGPDRDRFEE